MHISVNADITPEQLLPLLRQTDFADNRDAKGRARMLTTTRLHVSAWESDHLIGFARCLTDGVYMALVLEVVVDEPCRGRGVGSALLRTVTNELTDVDEILLGCEEGLVPFYKKLGWSRDDGAVMMYEGE